MSDYRRFVSYIYAYKNGKKERNVGFAKIEVRGGRLKMNIQLDSVRNDAEGLDVYGFVRKKEKLYGILLGEMETGMRPVFRAEEDPGNIRESGHSLNEIAGLWIKGAPGENYITIWDDEPVNTMELETETIVESSPTAETETIREVPPTVETETIVESPAAAEIETIVESPLTLERPINGVRAQEAAGLTATPDFGNFQSLFPSCPHLMPFPEDEAGECIRITPRELQLFRKKDWNPQRNNFVLHGYYQFRHLLFGCFADGTHFLGVPGYLNPRERQTAAAFGFPLFKEAKEQQRNGKFGYWCRPI